MVLKVVLAEDNDIYREKLKKIISNCDGIKVVYSTNNGKELLKVVRKLKPEIIITDIEMPFMSGIDVIKEIRNEIPYVEIIFITSYRQYIEDAIRLYAFDFIEKDHCSKRLIESIEKIKNRYITIDKMVCFKTKNSTRYVRTNDLYFVESFMRKTRIYTSNGIFVSNNILKEVNDMLDSNIFYKSSRFNIINLTKILSIKPYSNKSLKVHFRDKEWIAYLSRVKQEEFRAKLDNL